MTAYTLRSAPHIIRDTPEHIDFHIKNGDYFAFLATAMGFMQEKIGTCDVDSHEANMAKDLRNDLRYVHANYTIVRKTKP